MFRNAYDTGESRTHTQHPLSPPPARPPSRPPLSRPRRLVFNTALVSSLFFFGGDHHTHVHTNTRQCLQLRSIKHHSPLLYTPLTPAYTQTSSYSITTPSITTPHNIRGAPPDSVIRRALARRSHKRNTQTNTTNTTDTHNTQHNSHPSPLHNTPNLYTNADVTTWSPQGRLLQVEYAMEAVNQGSACLGLKSKDYAIVASIKRYVACSSTPPLPSRLPRIARLFHTHNTHTPVAASRGRSAQTFIFFSLRSFSPCCNETSRNRNRRIIILHS
jgi:hypothetical protein